MQDEEQMKIQEMMYNQEQKMKGLPTSEEQVSDLFDLPLPARIPYPHYRTILLLLTRLIWFRKCTKFFKKPGTKMGVLSRVRTSIRRKLSFDGTYYDAL